MALTYGFYNSYAGDRKYDAMQISEMFDGILADGIIPSQGQLFAVTAGGGMTVNVGTGRAWFFHSWTKNDSVMMLTVSASDVSRPRIDAVVLEVNRDQEVRANSIKIVSGEAAVNPVKPTLVTTDKVHQYPLAYITVGAGVEEITAENIENAVGLTPTPFATGVLETTPLDELWNQWEGEWDTWFANIKLQLSGDIVANLQGQIDELRESDGIICTDPVCEALEIDMQSVLSHALISLREYGDAIIDAILSMNGYVNTASYGGAGTKVHTAKGTSIMGIIYGAGGGGGGGGGGTAGCGGGGGEGGASGEIVVSSEAACAPGATFNIVVGAAGVGGAGGISVSSTSSGNAPSGTNGTAGGTSSAFGVSARGGTYGRTGAGATTKTGGVGGGRTSGLLPRVGGSGATNYYDSSSDQRHVGPENGRPGSSASVNSGVDGTFTVGDGAGGGGGGAIAASYSSHDVGYAGGTGASASFGNGKGGNGAGSNGYASAGSSGVLGGCGGGGGGGGIRDRNGEAGGGGGSGLVRVYEKGVFLPPQKSSV